MIVSEINVRNNHLDLPWYDISNRSLLILSNGFTSYKLKLVPLLSFLCIKQKLCNDIKASTDQTHPYIHTLKTGGACLQVELPPPIKVFSAGKVKLWEKTYYFFLWAVFEKNINRREICCRNG